MIRIAKKADFASRNRRSYRIVGRWVGVFRERDGSFRAMETACRHANVNLMEGLFDGDEVVCPAHGWKYNWRTGECIWGGPGKLRPYRCEVRGEDIYISIRPLNEHEEDGEFDLDGKMGEEW